MGSYWQDEDGTDLIAEKEYTAPSAEPVPANTGVILKVEDASWNAGFGTDKKHVSVKSRVTKPAAYAGRVIFSKFWIEDLDPGSKDKAGNFDEDKAKKKRTNHRKMLMTIDANHKGRLGQKPVMPDDAALALALIGAEFWGKLDVWEIAGKKGNWIREVKPAATGVEEVAAKPRAGGGGTSNAFADDLDDDLPFITSSPVKTYKPVA